MIVSKNGDIQSDGMVHEEGACLTYQVGIVFAAINSFLMVITAFLAFKMWTHEASKPVRAFFSPFSPTADVITRRVMNTFCTFPAHRNSSPACEPHAVRNQQHEGCVDVPSILNCHDLCAVLVRADVQHCP